MLVKGACGITVIIIGNGFQILNKAVCTSISINALYEKCESNYFPSIYELIVEQTGFFNLVMATSLEKGKH